MAASLQVAAARAVAKSAKQPTEGPPPGALTPGSGCLFSKKWRLFSTQGRKALVLFRNGVDTLSKQATCASTWALVARTGVRV